MPRVTILILLFSATSVMAEEKPGAQHERQITVEPEISETLGAAIILPGIQTLNQLLSGLDAAPAAVDETHFPGDAHTKAWSPPEFMYDAHGDWEVGVGTRRAVGLVVKRPFR
ncbi:MAG TPA: hypothetical protein ENI80_07890 [Acidiferrobacteraceae bacterium]|nr:hypothetical protein [Acidiferrobacteraceae bacterium]